MTSIYIHIPFCLQKCTYCDFCSFTATPEQREQYVNALIKEIEFWREKNFDSKIKTLFIGGGTPTILSGEQLDRIFNALKTYWDFETVSEITIEANPATVESQHIEVFKKHGVTRVSLGVQSSHDKILKRLGRAHTWQQFIKTYNMVRKNGKWDINLDLIYHLPGQTFKQWQETLEAVLDLGPEHISCYSLQLEEGTPLHQSISRGRYKLSSDSMDRKMHHWTIERLGRFGYDHYEISNFSKPGHQCSHNVVYWERGPYIGMGLGAHGFDGKQRMANPINLEEYMTQINQKNQLPYTVVETLTPEAEIFETAMLGLRMRKGIDEKWVLDATLNPKAEQWKMAVEKLRDEGLIVWEKGVIKLSIKGMDVSNSVFSTLMEL